MESSRGRRDREEPRGLLRLDLEGEWTVEELHNLLQSSRYAHASISLALQEIAFNASDEEYPRYDRRLLYREWENRILFSGYEHRGVFGVPSQLAF